MLCCATFVAWEVIAYLPWPLPLPLSVLSSMCRTFPWELDLGFGFGGADFGHMGFPVWATLLHREDIGTLDLPFRFDILDPFWFRDAFWWTVIIHFGLYFVIFLRKNKNEK